VTRILALMAASLAAMAIVGADAQQRTPVIVELFTSEGCSSCPPADEVLTRLDREQPIPGVEVIALSEHVTYWNSSAWHDPFSALSFSWRQFGYKTLFHLDDAYTPQIVVNGQTQMTGSEWEEVNRAVRAAAQGPRAAVSMNLKSGDILSAQVAQVPKSNQASDVLLAVTEGNLESSVSGGENGGHRLRHTGVVRRLTTLGHLDAKKEVYSGETRLKLNPQWNRANLKFVLFVQDRDTRQVLGAEAIRP
jgi:hypothetical protein